MKIILNHWIRSFLAIALAIFLASCSSITRPPPAAAFMDSYGRNDVIRDDVLRHQSRDILLHRFKQLILADGILDFHQGGVVDHFQDARFLRVEGQVNGSVHKVVADHLADIAVAVQQHRVDTGVLDFTRNTQRDGIALFDHDLAGLGIDDILRRNSG